MDNSNEVTSAELWSFEAFYEFDRETREGEVQKKSYIPMGFTWASEAR